MLMHREHQDWKIGNQLGTCQQKVRWDPLAHRATEKNTGTAGKVVGRRSLVLGMLVGQTA